jgi:hypothetical protein
MTAPGAEAPLDAYDIAFLAGGTPRVVETAVVALVRARRLRIHSPGQLVTADLSRRHPVEAAVLDAVGPTGHRSVDTVSWRVRDDERLVEIGRRLRREGLLGRLGALPRLARDHRTPTRAGRHLLRDVRERPATGDAEVLRVALGGPAAMTDQRLRAEIFERPTTTLAPPTRGGRSHHDIDHSDPRLAAYRTGGTAATAGVYGILKGGIGGSP